MQTCFREYPDIYGSELEGEDGDDDSLLDEASPPPIDPTEGSIPAAATSATPEPQSPPSKSPNLSSSDASTSDAERARAATDGSDAMRVPKAAHDATGHVSVK